METPPIPKEDRGESRRSFVAISMAVIAGLIAFCTPLVAGIITFLSPLLRKKKSSMVRIALLSQVPADGMPRFFPVVADRQDVWNRYPQQRVGGVYLVRQASDDIPKALTAKCPHAGCFIGYTAGADRFQCPCHTSAFRLDGKRMQGDREVAPRDMDLLPVELREVRSEAGPLTKEVWVEFLDFQTGRKDQVVAT